MKYQKARDPVVVLRRLKEAIAKLEELGRASEQCLSRIFLDTYTWVEARISKKQSDTTKRALESLSKTLRRSFKCVESWYYCGKFGVEHDCIDASPNALRALRSVQQTISKADKLTALSMLKKAGDNQNACIAVMRFCGKAKIRSGYAAAKRIKSYTKKGLATRATLDLELLAIQTLANEVFGVKTLVYVVDAKSGKPLVAKGISRSELPAKVGRLFTKPRKAKR